MGVSGGYELNFRFQFPPAAGSRFPKANILIDRNGRACISDFGLLAIISDEESFLASCIAGGLIPWMSPELLDPKSFGLENSHLTKQSDCYALGMVAYEILSGETPFAPSTAPILDVLRGERPERPHGAQGAWFTDGIWGMLELCWKPQPHDRPSLNTVLQRLQGTTRPPRLSSHPDRDVGVDADDQSDDTTAGDPGAFSVRSKVSGSPSTILVVKQVRWSHVIR